jgi:hypothetical protein
VQCTKHGLFVPVRAELQRRGQGEVIMLDVIYLSIGFGFLALTVLYVVACDHL